MKRRRDAPEPLDAERAFAYAVRALAQRALTESELRDRLRRRGATPDVIAATLERLREYGFVDDAGLAVRAARDERLGTGEVKRRLRARGIDTHTIEDALAARDPDADVEGARQLFERYRGRWVGERAYVKAYAFLSRRGYPSGVVRTVLEDLRRDAPDEDLDVED